MENNYSYADSDGTTNVICAFEIQQANAFEQEAKNFAKMVAENSSDYNFIRVFKSRFVFPVPLQTLQNNALHPPLADVKNQTFTHVIYLNFRSLEAAQEFINGKLLTHFLSQHEHLIKDRYIGLYKNSLRYNHVSEEASKYYLFNYFITDNQENALNTWRTTSAWFYQHTACLSSYNMQSIDDKQRYGLINFAHWNHLIKLFLAAKFRPSFQSTVMDSFRENRMVVRPILYRQIYILKPYG